MIGRLRLIAIFLVLLTAGGCSDSGSRLIGKWRQVPDGRFYDFQSGGQVVGTENGRNVHGTWEVKENRGDAIVVNIATSRGESPDATITFDGPDKFRLTEGGTQLPGVFERQK